MKEKGDIFQKHFSWYWDGMISIGVKYLKHQWKKSFFYFKKNSQFSNNSFKSACDVGDV